VGYPPSISPFTFHFSLFSPASFLRALCVFVVNPVRYAGSGFARFVDNWINFTLHLSLFTFPAAFALGLPPSATGVAMTDRAKH